MSGAHYDEETMLGWYEQDRHNHCFNLSDDGWSCTRTKGHFGPHMAHYYGDSTTPQLCPTTPWPNARRVVAPEVIKDWPNNDTGAGCHETAPSPSPAYWCTRGEGHDGPHVAREASHLADQSQALAVWDEDGLYEIHTFEEKKYRKATSQELLKLVLAGHFTDRTSLGAGHVDRCHEKAKITPGARRRSTCKREANHKGPHTLWYANGELAAVWATGEEPAFNLPFPAVHQEPAAQEPVKHTQAELVAMFDNGLVQIDLAACLTGSSCQTMWDKGVGMICCRTPGHDGPHVVTTMSGKIIKDIKTGVPMIWED